MWFLLFKMMFMKCLFSFAFICINVCPINKGDIVEKKIERNENSLMPTVQIAFLIRNKAHTLPYFLGNLERLNYPKNRIGLYIRIDHSEDASTAITEKWINHMKSQYHHVDYNHTMEGVRFPNEVAVNQWTKERYENIIFLREEALYAARNSWANYLLMLDVDVMIINENIIHSLAEHQLPVVSPLLNCTNSGAYSNFWGSMTEDGYYKRSEDYFDIQERKKKGLFEVKMVHSVYFINLNIDVTTNLSFLPKLNSKYPLDDIILFAKSAEENDVPMFIDNTNAYGYIMSPVEEGGFLREKEMFQHAKFQIMLDQEDTEEVFTLKPSKYIEEEFPLQSKLGFDEIYLINLKRRTDRRIKMEYLFKQLGIDVKYFEAVDGKKLNKTYLDSLNVKQMPGYSDPYHKRDLKMGEIGCFLSHYFIWMEMIEKNYDRILIFEDDIRFGQGFIRSLNSIMNESEAVKPNWELLYIGRKRMSDKETYVDKSSYLVYPDYTYWTLGYAITKTGVQKLLREQPLSKMLAVDEYLPIMFDRHPREDWKKHFEQRDVIAISSQPLLIEPTHYTGEPKYISDTEDSIVI